MEEEFIRNSLFRPFKTTKGNAGMGIGVYESREFVVSLGGRLDVSSVPGSGTKFLMYLPITSSVRVSANTDAQQADIQMAT